MKKEKDLKPEVINGAFDAEEESMEFLDALTRFDMKKAGELNRALLEREAKKPKLTRVK